MRMKDCWGPRIYWTSVVPFIVTSTSPGGEKGAVGKGFGSWWWGWGSCFSEKSISFEVRRIWILLLTHLLAVWLEARYLIFWRQSPPKLKKKKKVMERSSLVTDTLGDLVRLEVRYAKPLARCLVLRSCSINTGKVCYSCMNWGFRGGRTYGKSSLYILKVLATHGDPTVCWTLR